MHRVEGGKGTEAYHRPEDCLPGYACYQEHLAEEVEHQVRLVWDSQVHMTHADFAGACKFAAWMGFMFGMVTGAAIVVLAVKGIG